MKGRCAGGSHRDGQRCWKVLVARGVAMCWLCWRGVGGVRSRHRKWTLRCPRESASLSLPFILKHPSFARGHSLSSRHGAQHLCPPVSSKHWKILNCRLSSVCRLMNILEENKDVKDNQFCSLGNQTVILYKMQLQCLYNCFGSCNIRLCFIVVNVFIYESSGPGSDPGSSNWQCRSSAVHLPSQVGS